MADTGPLGSKVISVTSSPTSRKSVIYKLEPRPPPALFFVSHFLLIGANTFPRVVQPLGFYRGGGGMGFSYPEII